MHGVRLAFSRPLGLVVATGLRYSRSRCEGRVLTIALTDLHDDPPRVLKLHLEIPLVRRVLRIGTWVMLAMIRLL